MRRNLSSWVPVSSRSTGWIERWSFFWGGTRLLVNQKLYPATKSILTDHPMFLSANQGLNDTRIQCWNSSGCNLANNETGVVHTPSNIKKYSINTAVSNVFFCPRKHGTKCVFILRFSSTSAYGILDSDSSATGVTWCYTLKIRLDVRASACIAALAMLLVPGCFGFY